MKVKNLSHLRRNLRDSESRIDNNEYFEHFEHFLFYSKINRCLNVLSTLRTQNVFSLLNLV